MESETKLRRWDVFFNLGRPLGGRWLSVIKWIKYSAPDTRPNSTAPTLKDSELFDANQFRQLRIYRIIRSIPTHFKWIKFDFLKFLNYYI